MKNLRNVISVVLILSIVLSLFGGCSINDVKQFAVKVDGESQALQALEVKGNFVVDCPLASLPYDLIISNYAIVGLGGDRWKILLDWDYSYDIEVIFYELSGLHLGSQMSHNIEPCNFNQVNYDTSFVFSFTGSSFIGEKFVFSGNCAAGHFVENLNITDDSHTFPFVLSVPEITVPTQPASRTMFETENCIVSVGASVSAGTLSYQWYDNNVLISGATSADYNLSTLIVGEHKLKCKLSAPDAVDVYTTEATITVLPKPKLLITDQPKSLNMVIGENKIVNVVATVQNGMGEIKYQWYDGDTLIVGATSADYNLSTLVVGTHQIKCEISSANAVTVTSNVVNVIVKNRPVITITKQPESKTIIVGDNASITVTATVSAENAPLSYQWKKDDVAIDKANTETLALKNLPIGNYNIKCVLAAGDEIVESEVATIVVSAVPIPTPSPTPGGGGSGGGGGGITPTPTPTIKPSPTPTVTPQPTEKPTPTIKPTPTPIPTPTPSNAPTVAIVIGCVVALVALGFVIKIFKK